MQNTHGFLKCSRRLEGSWGLKEASLATPTNTPGFGSTLFFLCFFFKPLYVFIIF